MTCNHVMSCGANGETKKKKSNQLDANNFAHIFTGKMSQRIDLLSQKKNEKVNSNSSSRADAFHIDKTADFVALIHQSTTEFIFTIQRK